jgi:uncharacterized protein YjiS (DUF1127 family)
MELLSTVTSELMGRVSNYARKRRFYDDVRYLGSFDDRMLGDIGLTRPEIEEFVRKRMSLAALSGGPTACANAV